MALDFGFVAKRLDPTQSIGVGPDGVVDAGKVHGQLAPAFFKEVRQEKTHLKEGQWIFGRPHHLVPGIGCWRHIGRLGDEFVPPAGRRSADCSDSPGQDCKELEGTRDLPSAQVPGGSIAPDMGGNRGAGTGNFMGHFNDQAGVHA